LHGGILGDPGRDRIHVVGRIEVIQNAVAKMRVSAVEAQPFPVAGFIEAVDGNLDLTASNGDAVDVVVHRIVEM
jgi:hypothetical protein